VLVKARPGHSATRQRSVRSKRRQNCRRTPAATTRREASSPA